ncbi:hypothetical protein WMF30_01685 [Sorangium sp. So ce134]
MGPLSIAVAVDVDVAGELAVDAELDVVGAERPQATAMGAAPPATRRSFSAARRSMSEP